MFTCLIILILNSNCGRSCISFWFTIRLSLFDCVLLYCLFGGYSITCFILIVWFMLLYFVGLFV